MKENWFRRLEVENPAHFAQLWRAEANESIAKYGFVFGSAIYAMNFLVFKMAATYAFVMCVWLLIFAFASPERPLPNIAVQALTATLLEGVGATILFVLHYLTTLRQLGVRELLLSVYWSAAALWPVYVSALGLGIRAAW